jgi:hypothetical protein
MDKSVQHLFAGGSLHEYLGSTLSKALDEVRTTDREYILRVSEEDFCRYLIAKYRRETPVLRVDERYAEEPEEAKVDVSQDFRRGIRDRSRPHYITGSLFKIVIPFDGEGALFTYQPSTYTMNPPLGYVEGNKLLFAQVQTDLASDALRAEFNRNLTSIQSYLGYVKSDVAHYQANLEGRVRKEVQQRRHRLLAEMDLAGGLGIPIRRRADAPRTYAIPDVRRKPAIERPLVKPGSYRPEPALEAAEYDRILGIMASMVKVMERSPGAFSTMGEDDIRQQFLVQLNGQYEGRATGETFNYQGKTDILIREGDRNVFIAECKFWRGEKKLTETIDQLLGYLSWQDTKAAILVFNRNQSFSLVIEKIPGVVKAHPCFKREDGQRSETTFRYIFHQPGDLNRELWLTVMAFDVPAGDRQTT